MEDLNRRNNNSVEMSGEAALVVAARGGQATVLRQLLTPSSHTAPPLSHQAAALYAASRSGQLEAVKFLIDYGVSIDTGIPEPPLVAALMGGHSDVAMLLIHHGADCDVKDLRGNSCLHLACASGLYDVVRCLCAMGCGQGHNLRGQYPLHIAARNGFIHIVRLLCFYGCKIDQRNGDGIRADITALKYGHNNIAELLDKLRVGGWNAHTLRSQLSSGSRPLVRLQVRLLGHSGSGKSALSASLNAGLLHALLRRSTSLTTRSRPSSPSQSSQIEMDITPRHNSLSFDSCTTPNYTPTKGIQVHQMDLNNVGDITVWDFSGQEAYFQIYHHFLSDVSIPQPATILPYSVKKRNFNSNELAKYTAANDNVITNIGKSQMETNIDNLCNQNINGPSANCNSSKYSQLAVYVIMFNLEKPYYIQLQQCTFWLNFIISKQSPCAGPGGLGNVILIGSHADLRVHKTAQGEYIYPAGDNLLQEVQQIFSQFFKIHPQVLALDCNASTSVGLRSFKSYLASVKRSITQGTDFVGKQRTTVFGSEYDLIHGSPVRLQLSYIATYLVSLGNWNGFLEATLSWITSVRKSMESFPVMDRQAFMDNVRCHVNLLANDDHIIDVIHHLHVLGEVLYVGEVVVLCCGWLCGMLGALLGRGGLREARALGVYTAHDFQAHFGCCDASQLLGLLQEMRLCTMCEVDDEIEYEFPCFNFVETLEGLWDSDDPRYQSSDSCYGGLKLGQARGFTHLLTSIFPHIQVELRDDIESLKVSDSIGDWGNDCDLYQWWHGSKISWLNTECLLTLDGPPGCEYLDLRVRGSPGSSHVCFLHLEKILHCIHQAMSRTAPGLTLDYSVMSANQLRTHCEDPYTWTGSQIITKMLEYQNDETSLTSEIVLTNPNTNKKESLQNLICFDSPTISETLEWCPEISVRNMNPSLLSRLSALLDAPHPLGAHWCMLAVSLGVSQDSIAAFDAEMDTWHTIKLLMTVNCNIGTLLAKLEELGRTDAVELILSLAALYRVTNYSDLDTLSSKSDDENVVTCDLSKESNVSTNTILGSRIHTDV